MLAPWKKSHDKPRQLTKKHLRILTWFLPTKVGVVKAMVFPVVTYGCESCTIKKAEHQRTDAFELWCWRLFRVPWATKRSNQSILKEISLNIHWKDWCWSWSLAPDAKSQLIGKDPDAGKDWRQKEKGSTEDETVGWHHHFNGHESEMEMVKDREAWSAAVHAVSKSRTWLSDWTTRRSREDPAQPKINK